MHLRVAEFHLDRGGSPAREKRNRNSFALAAADARCGGDTLSIEFRAASDRDITVQGVCEGEKKILYNARRGSFLTQRGSLPDARPTRAAEDVAVEGETQKGRYTRRSKGT